MTFQDRAKEAIRASGGRITGQRELLLDLLAGSDDGIDADQLFRLASERDPNISLPTVYRTLHTLEDAHVIESRYASRDHDRKVYALGVIDVVNFTCRRCGHVYPVQLDSLTWIKHQLSDQLGAEIASVCMCASGLCADCRE
ncbi:MAG: transcriptional repressor [Chloroflexi bacterium]|nr:transcriptional repressor [Chloroflexota bacterium]